MLDSKYILFLLLISCDVKTTAFNSSTGVYTLNQPIVWIHEDEDEGTDLFYCEKRTGNFRITTLRLKGVNCRNLSPEEKIEEHLDQEILENDGAKQELYGKRKVVYYKKTLKENEKELVLNCWTFGIEKTLFICTYTNYLSQQNTRVYRKELRLCKEAIMSIELNNNK